MKRALVETAIPYPLIWDEGQFSIRIGNELFIVRFKRTFGPPPIQQGGMPSAMASSNVELRYDRLARLAHTELQIIFPTYIEDHQELVATVHRLVNRIIEVYRTTTGEFHLDANSKTRIVAILAENGG